MMWLETDWIAVALKKNHEHCIIFTFNVLSSALLHRQLLSKRNVNKDVSVSDLDPLQHAPTHRIRGYRRQDKKILHLLSFVILH